MSVLWRKNLEDGTQACRLDDGSFIFLRNEVALIKIEAVFEDSVLHSKKVEFEVCEFNTLERMTVIASLLEDMNIESIVKFIKLYCGIILTDEIIDDIEATRLARRMTYKR